MKTLVVYESFFSNTQKIAEEIAHGIGERPDVRLEKVSDIDATDFYGVKLLVVGSPTRAFRPSPDTQQFLNSLESNSLKGIMVASFDTRMDQKSVKSGFLRFMMRAGGYAAKPIMKKLVRNGGIQIAEPTGFMVVDKEGPLADGELERAGEWGARLKELAIQKLETKEPQEA